MQLKFIHPEREKHRRLVFDLTGKVFWNYYKWTEYCRRGYIDSSHYDWDVSTLGMLGERPVTHWGIWGYLMRIGQAQVRVAGVGAVATDGEFRKRGLMEQTANRAIKACADAGYDLTLLFGIPDFYHKFGYVRAWPEQTYYVQTRFLPAEKVRGRMHKISLRQRPELAELYNHHHAGLTGTAVRPTYGMHGQKWQGYIWQSPTTSYLIVNPAPGSLELIEAVGNVDEILRRLRRIAHEYCAAEVKFPLCTMKARWLKNCDKATADWCSIFINPVKP